MKEKKEKKRQGKIVENNLNTFMMRKVKMQHSQSTH